MIATNAEELSTPTRKVPHHWTDELVYSCTFDLLHTNYHVTPLQCRCVPSPCPLTLTPDHAPTPFQVFIWQTTTLMTQNTRIRFEWHPGTRQQRGLRLSFIATTTVGAKVHRTQQPPGRRTTGTHAFSSTFESTRSLHAAIDHHWEHNKLENIHTDL